MPFSTTPITCLTVMMLISFIGMPSRPAKAAPPIYWCPDKPADQQYSATQEPGCVPLVKKKDPKNESTPSSGNPQRTVNINNLQHEVSGFLQRYNAYIACCSTDPSTLDEVTDLETHANDLLEAIQTGMSGENMKIRGMSFHQMLGPVNRANHNLQTLRGRLEKIGDSLDRMPSLGYTEAGIEKQRIEEEQEAISNAYGPLDLQGSRNTGTGIESTTLPTQVGSGTGTTSPSLPTQTGDEIGSSKSGDGFARTGADIGNTPASGTDIGRTPSTGFGIGSRNGASDSSSLPTQAGPNIGQ